MESLPLAVLDRAIQENESALRNTFGDAGLPEEWNSDLAALPRTSPNEKLIYYARVKHYYWLRYQQIQQKTSKRVEQTVEAAEAARKLLRREPFVTVLAGNSVKVTGRSYNALAEIAAHYLRMLELHEFVEAIEKEHFATLQRYRAMKRFRWTRRARLEKLRRKHARLFTELILHRRALYAHALTPDGAPATDVLDGHPAPWWRKASVEDDARLLLALCEVGPVRYAQMGRGARGEEDADSPFVEDFGFHSLLTWIEGKRHVPPAELYNQDVGQILASVRAGALAHPDMSDLED